MPRPATAAATARALAALARPGPATIAACSSSTLRALSFSAPRSLLAAAAVAGGETLPRFPSPWQAHSASFASSAAGGSSHGEGGSGRADTPTAVTSQPPNPPPFVQAGPVPGEAGGVVTYLAPLATTVARLKRLSLASCCLTTAAAPALAGLQVVGAAGTPAGVAAQVGIAAAIAGFGAFTTGLVHWFTKPYILSLAARVGDVHAAAAAAAAAGSATPTTATATVTRLDFFGRRTTAFLRLAEVRPPAHTVHPQVTFSDAAGKLFYIDADNWPKNGSDGDATSAATRLLGLLTPKEEGVEVGAEVQGSKGGRPGKGGGKAGGAAAA